MTPFKKFLSATTAVALMLTTLPTHAVWPPKELDAAVGDVSHTGSLSSLQSLLSNNVGNLLGAILEQSARSEASKIDISQQLSGEIKAENFLGGTIQIKNVDLIRGSSSVNYLMVAAHLEYAEPYTYRCKITFKEGWVVQGSMDTLLFAPGGTGIGKLISSLQASGRMELNAELGFPDIQRTVAALQAAPASAAAAGISPREMERLRAERNEYEREFHCMQKEVSELQIKLQTAQDAHREAVKSLTIIEGEHYFAKQRVETLQTEMTRQSDQVAQAHSRAARAEARACELETAFRQAQAQAARAAELQAELRSVQVQAGDFKSQMVRAQQEAMSTSQRVAQLESQLVEARQSQAVAAEHVRVQAAQASDLGAQLQKAQRDYSEMALKWTTAESGKQQLERQLAALQAEMTRHSDQIVQAQAGTARAEARVCELETALRQAQPQAARVAEMHAQLGIMQAQAGDFETQMMQARWVSEEATQRVAQLEAQLSQATEVSKKAVATAELVALRDREMSALKASAEAQRSEMQAQMQSERARFEEQLARERSQIEAEVRAQFATQLATERARFEAQLVEVQSSARAAAVAEVQGAFGELETLRREARENASQIENLKEALARTEAGQRALQLFQKLEKANSDIARLQQDLDKERSRKKS
jgi:chromosome segregation ATPase